MSRLDQYLAYHTESARIGDIDPSYSMLLYVCDRFELTVEQRYWLAWIYAMTYCGASTFYVYNEFPDYENVDVGRLQRWWDERGREEIICQTDRRWVRSSSLFVPAFRSYHQWVGTFGQHEHFSILTRGYETPEARYDAVYRSARELYSFGQFSLFLYLEALHTITPLELCPTDLDLNMAWSCRNGLYYAYGLDQYIDDAQTPIRLEAREATALVWADLRSTLAKLEDPPTVWQTETMLCAYRKFHRGKRYVGYYLDRQAEEIAKMQDHVRDGVCWGVLWQYRAESYDKANLAEQSGGMRRLATSPQWRERQRQRTMEVVRSGDQGGVE